MSAIIVIAITVVVGFGAFLSTLSLSQVGETSSQVSNSLPVSSVSYSTSGQPNSPSSCMDVAGGQGEGYFLTIYLPTHTSVGDSICIESSIKNVANQSVNLVPFEQIINITDQSGEQAFSAACMILQPNPTFGPGTSSSCTSEWNTGNPLKNGTLPQAGRYNVFVSVEFWSGNSSSSSVHPLYTFKDQAIIDLLPLSYTRTIICSVGYATVTESVIVNNNSTTTVGSTNLPPPPPGDTTVYLGSCYISGP